MTDHLYRFFPVLKEQSITTPGGSIGDVIRAIDKLAPGFSDYILDEHGALRRHVSLSINNTVIIDRTTLSETVRENDTVYIFQALSGG